MSSKILIATPNSDTAMRLLGWFAKHGSYVALEPDTTRLKDGITAGKPDCVVLDDAIGAHVLPTLVSQLKSQKDTESALLLVMGAFSEEQEVALFKAGADEVLLKPLRTASLTFRIARLLKK